MTSDTRRRGDQMGPEGSPAEGIESAQNAPGMAGMPLAGDVQTGSLVQDIVVALQRIERRLARIEEHLGVLPEEGAGTESVRGPKRRREETAQRRSARTSPYA